MSACEVENGLQQKAMKSDDRHQDSGLKRMEVVETGEDLRKLLKEASPPAALNGQPVAEKAAAPTEVFEATEPVVAIKQEAEEIPEIKEEETSTVEPEPLPELHSQDETPRPRSSSPKEMEIPPVEAILSEDLSRKRSIEKEQEGEGGSSGSDSDSSRKKTRTEQETETSTNLPNGTRLPVAEEERERMISDFVSEVSMSSDSITEATERLAKEVENLTELATSKEMEWNTILRVKKLKEEMLERLLRRKRMNHFDGQFIPEPVPDLGHKSIPGSLQIPLRHPRLAEMGRLPQRPILPKPLGTNFSPVNLGREGRNGPIVDVKSIIDDYSGVYRSRHPESPARRGRRVRGPPPTSEQRFPSVNPSLISMANMALGSGASVRTVSDHMNYMGMGGVDHSRGEVGPNKECSPRGGGNGAKPYPEVTLHPVSPPSLLHQVLTKPVPSRPASNFSPTLARLLTAPERRPSPPPNFRPPAHVSIADILSSTKFKNLKVSEETVKYFPNILMALLKDQEKEAGESPNNPNVTSDLTKEPEESSEARLHPDDPLEEHISGPSSQPSPVKKPVIPHSSKTSTTLHSSKKQKVLHSSKPPKGVVLKRPAIRKTFPGAKVKKASLQSKRAAVSTSEKVTTSGQTSSSGEASGVSSTSGLASTSRGPSTSRPSSTRKVQPASKRSATPSSNSSSTDLSDQDEPPPIKRSRNEITITPVAGNHPTNKKEDVVCLDDDDGEASDRLVIDEGNDDVPVCQGCRSKSAQFVCAGCGNQWYCSRECQVSAWEEHSDMCSG